MSFEGVSARGDAPDRSEVDPNHPHDEANPVKLAFQRMVTSWFVLATGISIALAAGVTSVVTKPVKHVRLIQAIRSGLLEGPSHA
jgi:hypothetical protein